MTTTAARAATLWLCALLGACVSDTPARLGSEYRPVKRGAQGPRAEPKAVAAAAPACGFHIAAFEDRRTNKEMLGQLATRSVVSEDVGAWVRSGFATLPGYAEAPTAASFGIQIELLKAYLQSQATTKVATVVLRVAYPGAEGTPVQYRGTNTSVNWSSSTNEAREAMNLAIGDMLGKVRADLGQRCAAATTASR